MVDLARFEQHRFWDRQTQRIFEGQGEALDDCILQNKDEGLALARFMVDHNVRSFLEIGIWTGRWVSALADVLDLDQVYAVDQGWAEQRGFSINLHPQVEFLRANSESEEYRDWRGSLGHIDMVLIDANHSYHAVKRDFEINRAFQHRYLVFHDITGAHPATRGVKRLWDELEGWKHEIIHPHRHAGLTTPTMGIGIWAQTTKETSVS